MTLLLVSLSIDMNSEFWCKNHVWNTAGSQMVTRRGAEAVVVIAAPEFRRLCSGLSLRDVLRNAPRGEPLDLERSAEPVRNIEL